MALNVAPTDFLNGSDARLFNLGKTVTNPPGVSNSPLRRRDGGLVVNAGIAKDSYFRNFGTYRNSYWDLLEVDLHANAPGAAAFADSLWKDSVGAKGMFAMRRDLKLEKDHLTSVVGEGAEKLLGDVRYGFQFHYNPMGVKMSYAGMPPYDVTMFTGGQEAFVPLQTAATGSALSFQLVLNRINDFKFFNPRSQRFKSGTSSLVWAGRFPSYAEQLQLYNKGTMYDVEFFLRTVMQITLPVSMRERNSYDGKTADLGFLTGIPVELHLGNGLRYLVRIDGFEITHAMFNERMVPMFSYVDVQCSRIPDFIPNSGSSAGQNNSSTSQRRDPYTSVGFYYTDPGTTYTSSYQMTNQVGVNPGSKSFSTSNLGG